MKPNFIFIPTFNIIQHILCRFIIIMNIIMFRVSLGISLFNLFLYNCTFFLFVFIIVFKMNFLNKNTYLYICVFINGPFHLFFCKRFSLNPSLKSQVPNGGHSAPQWAGAFHGGGSGSRSKWGASRGWPWHAHLRSE